MQQRNVLTAVRTRRRVSVGGCNGVPNAFVSTFLCETAIRYIRHVFLVIFCGLDLWISSQSSNKCQLCEVGIGRAGRKRLEDTT